jgi:hypothetical protein
MSIVHNAQRGDEGKKARGSFAYNNYSDGGG